jgi:hypothetical protein
VRGGAEQPSGPAPAVLEAGVQQTVLLLQGYHYYE